MGSLAITTRELLIADYGAVLTLWNSAEGVDICEGDAESDVRGYFERNPSLSRIALEKGDVVGAALCGHDGRRGYIYHLAVAPTHRGRGIAKRLVDECIDGLRRAGVPRAIILVANENATGRSFWERNGWEVIDGAVPMTREV
jgi:ribosomal protein S18 acetylase RimI-like enzyme